MSEFKVGEIAIYVRPGSPYYGQEVEILSGLVEHYAHDHINSGVSDTFFAYEITNLPKAFFGFLAKPEHLKKKKPPARDIDQKVSWDDCIWKPAGVVA